MANWYPTKTGNQVTDEGLRIAFDNIYSLRDQKQPETGTRPEQSGGSSVTVSLGLDGGGKPVFMVQGVPYKKLTFSDGRLVGMS